MGSVRSLIQNLALATFAVLLTVVAFEVFVRLFLPGWMPAAGDRRFWAYDETLGWRHRPNQTGV